MGNFNLPDPTPQFDSWLNTVLASIGSAANSIAQALKGFWRFIYDHIISQLATILSHVIQRIRDALAPILKILKTIRDYQQFTFDTIFRPIINFIQRLRQVLLIFRIFHLKFAQALDTRLARAESQLVGAFFTIQQYFNLVMSYFDLIMNPFGILHTGVYLSTAVTAIGRLWGMLVGAMSPGSTAAQQSAAAHDSHLLDKTSLQNQLTLTAATGLQDDYATRYEGIWTALAARGYHRPF